IFRNVAPSALSSASRMQGTGHDIILEGVVAGACLCRRDEDNAAGPPRSGTLKCVVRVVTGPPFSLVTFCYDRRAFGVEPVHRMVAAHEFLPSSRSSIADRVCDQKTKSLAWRHQ